MERGTNAFTPYFLGLEMLRIGMDSQAVVAMRMAGMMGLWATKPAEMSRMVREKPEAAMDAWFGMMRAAMSGAGTEAMMRAAMRPVGRRTGANVRRLARLGPPSICG